MHPAEHDLAAAREAHPLHLEALLANSGEQRRRGDVSEVTRQVERKPPVAERARLQARRIGHRDHQHSTRDKQPRDLAQRSRRVGQVLERVPEDHRGPAHVEVGELAVDHIGPLGAPLDPERITPARPQGVEERAVACTYVEHRTGRRKPSESASERGARAAKKDISRAGEATLTRPVPARVRLLELRNRSARDRLWPRRRRDSGCDRTSASRSRRRAFHTRRNAPPRSSRAGV